MRYAPDNLRSEPLAALTEQAQPSIGLTNALGCDAMRLKSACETTLTDAPVS